MARITVEDCLKKIDNQYDLVLLAKERTSQLNSGAEMLVEKDNDKNTVVALREIGEGKVAIDELKKNAVLRLRKEPNESDDEVIEEEVSNDDFEKEIPKTEFELVVREKLFAVASPPDTLSIQPS